MSSEVADQYDGPPVVSPNVLNLKSRDGINRAGFPYSSSLEDADGPKLDGGISSAIYKSWEDESYGLHLRQSAVDGNDVVDVIAVHSLNGHPIKSFQDDNTGYNWLFQLQVDFRNVQVWSFKYRADVRVDNISLADVATQLRINIETKLQQGFMNSNPRIVFVGHGFGGTVIKKTLLDWNKLAGADNSLTRNVLGLIFCSTQHSGKFPGPLLNVLLASNITNRLTAWFQTEGNRLRYPMESLWFQTDLSTLTYQVESANRDFQNILEHFPRIVCLADNIGLGTTGSPPYADLALIPWRDGVRLDKTLLDTAKVSGRDDEVFRHILEKLSQWLQSPRPSAPRFLPVRSDEGGVRILTLDGGGVRGLSSLLILKAIMERIQIIKNLPRLPRVSEYFDLVAGTSTGGLIAIMLVRLEMDVNHAIDSYRYLSGQIFKRTGWYFPGKVTIKRSLVHPVFKAEPLEQEVKKLVRNHLSPQERRLVYPNVSEATLLAPTDSGCRMFVCANKDENAETVRLRSYRLRNGRLPDFSECKIWEAARATAAAPWYFPKANIGRTKFMDGGLGSNNPVRQAWSEVHNPESSAFPSRNISSIVSIGTGLSPNLPPEGGLFQLPEMIKYIIGIATDAQTHYREMRETMDQMGLGDRLIRLNIDLGSETIDLDDYTKLGRLEEITETYIQNSSNEINRCADYLVNTREA